MTRRMWWKSKLSGDWKNLVLEKERGSQIEQACYLQLKGPDTVVDSGVLLHRTFPKFKNKEDMDYWTIYRPGGSYYLEPEKVPEQIRLILLIEGN